ncbi:leukocyte tyrosine kinase receptor-like [Ptychodera flava]|uniref:leukocyte tyrosine kinase receptor-like n=1 Tax=Ptychodera flava TaxID=63121 RepID=UPI00396A8B36
MTVPYEHLSLAFENLFVLSWNYITVTGQAEPLGCPAGKYGGFCQYDCICQNGAICHTFNGACKCQKGWKGVACDIPYKHLEITQKTISTYYDDPASLFCHAYNIQFENDLWNQSHFSWYINGKLHDSMFDENTFVTEQIQETYSYSSIEVLFLTENYTGEYRCVVEDLSGVIYSDRGYAEITGCNRNKWGDKCELDCACVHALKCDRYSGCICSLGWTGLHCEQACRDGMFGNNCSEKCLCQSEHTMACDSENGRCKCLEGVCGELCEERCSCRPWQKATCNGTSGCLCVEVSPGQYRYEPQYNEGIMITVAIFSVLAIFGVAAVVLCNKHKNKEYKHLDDEEREICNVFKETLGKCQNWSIKPTSLTKSNQLLGEGSFGQVYQGNFKPPGSKITEDVAIKSLLPANRNYHCNADFAREISCLIKLQGHPNIVILKGIVLQQGGNCFVMECATCGDLLNYLHRLRNPIYKKKEKELLCYTRHITLGMQYMQKKKILHRDLSARNILLFNGGVAKIGDFGLSRDASETKGVYVKVPWAENQTALPLKWMPPEFLTRGEFYFKSDVWSFGVLLWEICTHGDSPSKKTRLTSLLGE